MDVGICVFVCCQMFFLVLRNGVEVWVVNGVLDTSLGFWYCFCLLPHHTCVCSK